MTVWNLLSAFWYFYLSVSWSWVGLNSGYALLICSNLRDRRQKHWIWGRLFFKLLKKLQRIGDWMTSKAFWVVVTSNQKWSIEKLSFSVVEKRWACLFCEANLWVLGLMGSHSEFVNCFCLNWIDAGTTGTMQIYGDAINSSYVGWANQSSWHTFQRNAGSNFIPIWKLKCCHIKCSTFEICTYVWEVWSNLLLFKWGFSFPFATCIMMSSSSWVH